MPRCKLENCPVATSGRCLEDRGAECPNLLPDDFEDPAVQEGSGVPKASIFQDESFSPLPSGGSLEMNDARSFSRGGPTQIVSFVGSQDCGKTSLLARIHQMFQAGPIDDFVFTGSQTLARFEELNWLATLESKAPKVSMKRTSRQFDNTFLHLAVRHAETQRRVDLLLNDISGESFGAAIASQARCDDLLALDRADHLVVMVDGESLATARLRHRQTEQVMDFLQRVVQTKRCGLHTAVHIVVSKLDKLGGQDGPVTALEEQCKEKFGNAVFGSLAFEKLAARPLDGSLPTLPPIKKLFGQWVTVSHQRGAQAQPVESPSEWDRDFCRFGL